MDRPRTLPVGRLRRSLLAFYDARRRDLPWRGVSDPYAVWVSEVMLQQTRVETALPYYRRWMEQFPDLNALAAADLDEVLELWEGLGYYRRARHLHRGARLVRDRHRGCLPRSARALRELPGVGPYTAGAIASIAFGEVAAAVDGNARRVLARLLDEPFPRESDIARTAAELVDPGRPGDFNQALMELGATVCTPRAPACPACPWGDTCGARASGTPEARPLPRRRSPSRRVDFAVAVVRDPRGSFLLVRRPDEGLLAGLWEFPARRTDPGGATEKLAWCAARDAGVQLERPSAAALPPVRHAFTHLRATYVPWLFRIRETADATRGPGGSAAGALGSARGRAGPVWLGEMEPGGLALPAAQRRILDSARGVSRRR